MFVQISYFLLAIIGLGFLVFIHELGHYIVARHHGMKVEVFSIGFGRPIYSWNFQGVRWQIGWLPFGGYARIAGMQREGSREPYEIADGFYSKTPLQRIWVALAGPAVNIIFALIAFALIWSSGGREKTFAEFTHRIGWVDPKSALYEQGVRPGDVIRSYDGRPFDGIKDLQIASITKDAVNRIQGYKIDYFSGKHTNFDYTLKTYELPTIPKEKLLTIGVMTPARYFIYDQMSNPLLPGSPMYSSGIENNDRLVWADGEMLFSFDQLKSLINESTAFLTIQRDQTVFQTKVPRIHLDDLKMTPVQRAELDDWQHEADIKGRLQDLYFIPYLLSPNGDVEMRLDFIDKNDQEKAFERCQRCSYFNPLQEGDRILAVDGRPISSSYDLLNLLQTRRVLIIVQRNPVATQKIAWNEADHDFEEQMNLKNLRSIVSSIGTSKSVSISGNLHLLDSVSPKPLMDVPLPPDIQAKQAESLAQSRKLIESIPDPQKREEQLKEFERSQKNVILGIALKDREVIYNPTPWRQFVDTLHDTWFALSGLVSGSVSPKYMQGPIGIVEVIHQGWAHGAKEALFLMAVISLNLGIFNLLPIPVLDGGHICFSIYEGVTKKRVKSRTMERLIIPFVALLVGLIVYITFQDIARLFSRFF